MIRKLLATTAIATVVATGAFAQSGTTSTTTAPATTAPAAPAAGGTAGGAADATTNAAVAPAEGQLASNLIGEDVYNGTGDDAENIGNVNDLVLSDDGQIESIVIGVGGFLGIGEKNVAVAFNEIDWADRDGDRWIVVTTTADALKALPAFDRRAYEPASTANNNDGTAGGAAGTAAPAAGTAAPATGTAPADNAAAAGAAGGAAAGATGGAAMGSAAGTAGNATGNATDTADNAASGAPDRASLKEVPTTELTADNLEGTTVYGAQDAEVGEIGDVVLTTDGKVDAVLVDVGGFLGIGAKQVAVGMDTLKFMQDDDGNRYLYTNFTKEQLEAQPEYEESNWEAQRDQMRMTNSQ